MGLFNRLFPIESKDSKDAGKPGAAGIHFDGDVFPALAICAPSHDRGDDTGEYQENDERFERCLDAALNDESLYANAGHKRLNRIVAGWSRPVIRLYRWLRNQY